MMLLLACAKKLVRFDLAIRSGDYNIRNATMKGMDVEGKPSVSSAAVRSVPWLQRNACMVLI